MKKLDTLFTDQFLMLNTKTQSKVFFSQYRLFGNTISKVF